MTTHPDLRTDRVEHLRVELGLAGAAPLETEPARPSPPTVKQRARAFARRATAPVARPVLDQITNQVAARMRAELRTESDRLAVEVAQLQAQIATLVPALHALQSLGEGVELAASSRDALTLVHALEVNQELFKAELAEFRASLDELGRAIAPGAGLIGARVRLAELRERVNALDRRTRNRADGEGATAAVPDASRPPTDLAPASAFDYVGFEHRFRGDSDTVLGMIEARYLELLTDHQPVLDVGCGRGELLATLSARGITATGVELDEGMADEARARGLEVISGGAIEFLSGAAEQSFGAITAIHVVEHLELAALVEFLELAATRLVPGGVLVAETPNPTSLIVLGNSYILDPTHVWPLHPSLLTFLCERAGFRDIDLRFFSPAEAYHLPRVEAGPDTPEWVTTVNEAFERLDRTLFGPQEYAAIATTPA